jgi:hypothetical protein
MPSLSVSLKLPKIRLTLDLPSFTISTVRLERKGVARAVSSRWSVGRRFLAEAAKPVTADPFDEATFSSRRNAVHV